MLRLLLPTAGAKRQRRHRSHQFGNHRVVCRLERRDQRRTDSYASIGPVAHHCRSEPDASMSSGNLVTINNHGSLGSGGGLYILNSSQSVSLITGTASPDANGATVYDGDTVVGTATQSASLTATQILQNTLTINNGSSVTIVPQAPAPTPPRPMTKPPPAMPRPLRTHRYCISLPMHPRRSKRPSTPARFPRPPANAFRRVSWPSNGYRPEIPSQMSPPWKNRCSIRSPQACNRRNRLPPALAWDQRFQPGSRTGYNWTQFQFRLEFRR